MLGSTILKDVIVKSSTFLQCFVIADLQDHYQQVAMKLSFFLVRWFWSCNIPWIVWAWLRVFEDTTTCWGFQWVDCHGRGDRKPAHENPQQLPASRGNFAPSVVKYFSLKFGQDWFLWSNLKAVKIVKKTGRLGRFLSWSVVDFNDLT